MAAVCRRGIRKCTAGRLTILTLCRRFKIETVVCEVPVDEVLRVAQKVLKTGQPGDGKIFIYPLANAVKIRTGEQGEAAIIDDHK